MKFGLAQWLEVINGAWAMAALALFSVCVAYLIHEARARWPRKRFEVTLGMRVALSVGTISLGVLITRSMVWIWRVVYEAGTLSQDQMAVLVFGAAVGVAGFIFTIREYSRPLFGDLVWILSTIAIVLVAALTALPHFVR